jgi:hypothetical protein
MDMNNIDWTFFYIWYDYMLSIISCLYKSKAIAKLGNQLLKSGLCGCSGCVHWDPQVWFSLNWTNLVQTRTLALCHGYWLYILESYWYLCWAYKLGFDIVTRSNTPIIRMSVLHNVYETHHCTLCVSKILYLVCVRKKTVVF